MGASANRSKDVDVVIVGAGAAGLAAGQALRQWGISYRILEARERIGGRAWTEAASLGIEFDRGCAWLHSAWHNPLRALAERHGFTLAKDMATWFHLGGRFAGANEAQAIQTFIRHQFRAVIKCGLLGQDVSAAEVLDSHHPWAPLLDYLVAAINGVDAIDYSTGDAAAEDDTGDDWLVREGLGNLVRLAGAELIVETGCAVSTIDWTQTPVRVVSEHGQLRARTAIITVPVGVLAAGTPCFRPPLPEWKQTALEAIPMGRSEKIAFRFDGEVFGLPANTYLNASDSNGAFGAHIRPFGESVAIVYVGGRLAREIGELSDADAAAVMLDRLQGVFGNAIAGKLMASTVTGWSRDRWTRGGYSAARPGHNHRRRDLMAPLGERVYFAGEATSAAAFATVHGAWLSGYDAARRVDAQLSGRAH
ncbi:MAG: FAD-dependent oxidoreductase [Nitrococcus mobilis]|nr:FAD-dependent oxidoreductase [Nitrococcus mobilis]